MPPLPVCTTASASSLDMRTSPNSVAALTGARTSPSLMTPCRVDNLSGESTDLPSIGPTTLSTATRTPGGNEMRRSNSTDGVGSPPRFETRTLRPR